MRVVIQTLGRFSVSIDGHPLPGSSVRRSKVWTALKYMIAHYKRPVSSEELIDVLWPDQDCSDPSNSLKSVIYQLRKMLSDCGGEFRYVVYSQGLYSWNPAVDISADAAVFENTLLTARETCGENIENRAALLRKAIGIYRGEYLSGEAGELWLMNFRNYFRRLFLGAVHELADILKLQSEFEEAVLLLGEAIEAEPYEELLYSRQIELLILIGEYAHAKRQYKSIERLLRKEFDAEPSAEFKGLWHDIAKTAESRSADLDEVKTDLESNVKNNAILCGPETFKRIYSYHRYLNQRIQMPAFLGMMSIALIASSKEQDEAMRDVTKALRRIMLRTLRACDVICQYSADRFVLMITGAEEKHKMAPLIRIQKLYEKEDCSNGVTLSMQVADVG